jgi:amidase
VELVDHYLARIEALDGRLRGFVTVTPDLARAQARSARERIRDRTGDPPLLLGVPTAVKDLTATAGTRTTLGSLAHAHAVPKQDAHTVRLLREGGLPMLGKTSTPEFGLSAYTDNDLVGATRTPWDPTRSAGGSSGGAAAAVAAGLVPVAHGTDGGGSLRIPASACGVFGFKPGRGRVSSGPAEVDPAGMDVQGPITRTVRDAAAMLDVLAVPLPGDRWWAPPPPPGGSFLAATRRAPGRLRIGRYARPRGSDLAVHPDCLAAYEAASALLTRLGHEVVDIPNPLPPGLGEAFGTVWAVRSLRWPVDGAGEPALRPVTRWWREHGRGVSAERFQEALGRLQTAAGAAVAATQAYDAVLTPTLALPPQPPQWFTGDGDVPVELARQRAFTPFTALHNLTGQPAASLPLHRSRDGLPIGVMLAGRLAGETALLSLCAQVEQASPWAQWWPPDRPGDDGPH